MSDATPKACTDGGLCFAGDGPFETYISLAAAIGRELYLLGSNSLGFHWDGARWRPFSQPYVYDWVTFVASPGALWGLAIHDIESGPRPWPTLWRRDRHARAWTNFEAPFHVQSMWAADDTHLWVTDGGQLALFDGTHFSEPLAPGQIKSLTGTAWNDGWMVAGGKLWHLDGAAWSQWPVQPCGGDRLGFVVAHPGSPWVQCSGAPPTRLERWENNAWTTHLQIDPDAFVPSTELGVWKSTERTVRRADGSGLHRVVAGHVGRLPTRAYGASFWHVSNNGVAAEWDGSKWIERGRTEPVVLDAAASKGSLWLAGENGFVARRQDGLWQRVETEREEGLVSIAAHGEHVWAAGFAVALGRTPDGRWNRMHPFYRWAAQPRVWMSRDTPLAFALSHDFAFRHDLVSDKVTVEASLDGIRQLSGDDESHLWAAAWGSFARWDPATGLWVSRSPELHPSAVSARGDEVWGIARGQLLRHGANDEWQPVAWEAPAPVQVVVRGPGDVWVRDSLDAVWRHDGNEGRSVRASGCRRLIEGPHGIECLTLHGVEPAEDTSQVRLVSSGVRLLRKRGVDFEPLTPTGSGAWTDGVEAVGLQGGAAWRHRDGITRLEAAFPGGVVDPWASRDEIFALKRRPPAQVFRARGGVVEEVWSGENARALGGPSDALWLTGTGGLLQRWNGVAFEPAGDGFVGDDVDLEQVAAGEAPGELWIAVSNPWGRLLHRVDEQWEWEWVPANGGFSQVWAGGGRVWARGDDGLWERGPTGWRWRDPAWGMGVLGGDPEDGSALLDGFEGLWRIAPSE